MVLFSRLIIKEHLVLFSMIHTREIWNKVCRFHWDNCLHTFLNNHNHEAWWTLWQEFAAKFSLVQTVKQVNWMYVCICEFLQQMKFTAKFSLVHTEFWHWYLLSQTGKLDVCICEFLQQMKFTFGQIGLDAQTDDNVACPKLYVGI